MKKEEASAQLLTAEKIIVSNLTFTNLNIGGSRPAIRVHLSAYYDSPSAAIRDQSLINLTSTITNRNY